MKIENVEEMKNSVEEIDKNLHELEALNNIANGIEKCNEMYGSLDSFIDLISIVVRDSANTKSLRMSLNGDYVSEESKQAAIKLLETMMADAYTKIDDNLKKESLKMMKLSEK